jgi:hypothetical protein
MQACVRAEVHAFLEQVEQQCEPALAVIRNHPFVQGVAQGACPWTSCASSPMPNIGTMSKKRDFCVGPATA